MSVNKIRDEEMQMSEELKEPVKAILAEMREFRNHPNAKKRVSGMFVAGVLFGLAGRIDDAVKREKRAIAQRLKKIVSGFDQFSPGECDSKEPAQWYIDEIREDNPEYTDKQVQEDTWECMSSCDECTGAGCPLGKLRELTDELAKECGLEVGQS